MAAAKPKVKPKAAPKHLDYDLKPLAVGGLARYIEPLAGHQLFRVH